MNRNWCDEAIKKWVDIQIFKKVYNLYIRPHLEYGNLIFNSQEFGKAEIFNVTNKRNVISVVLGAWEKSKIKDLCGIWDGKQCRSGEQCADLSHFIKF